MSTRRVTGLSKPSSSFAELFSRRRWAVTAICVLLIFFVGILDYVTGYEMDFFLFYFVPIAISAWFAGNRPAFFCVLLSVVTWLVADMMSSHMPSSWFIEWWNAGIQGLTFSLAAFSTILIRNAFDQKQTLNSRLSELLGRLEKESRERSQAQEALIRQNDFLRHIFESITTPFYVVDAKDYTIVMANSATIPGGPPPGTKCYTLTHHRSEPCHGSQHECPMQVVKQTRNPFATEHVHYAEDGSARHVEIYCYPVLDDVGEVSQIIEYTLDITRHKEMEHRLHNNAERIKLFAYSVSHDLKSPLIGINGLTNLLHKQYGEALGEKGAKYCDQILKASENALHLVEDINVFIKTKESPFAFEQVNPKELLKVIRDGFKPLLSTRGIEWTEPEFIPPLTADRLSLMRVFQNLVDNALKYGGEKMSAIAVGYEESSEYHTFNVTDNGIGIERKDCEKIFELFQRHSTSRNIDGAGLGLSIVKEIAAKHGGKVWAEPGRSGGATFHISIAKNLEPSSD